MFSTLLVLLIFANSLTAQSPRKYAFKVKKDTISYQEGQKIYYINSIYKEWTGHKFMYGFYKADSTTSTAAIYDTIAYRYIHRKKMGFYKVQKNTKWGLLKEDYSIWIPLEYDKINYNTHVQRYYISIEKNKKYGILDEDGKVILAAIYDEILSDGFQYKVIKNGKMGIIDGNGKELVPVCFENILYHKNFDYQQLQKNGKWSILNWTKNDPCNPVKSYDQIENITLFFVCRDSLKYGLLDFDGKEILPSEYDFMSPFFSKFLGTILVGKNGKVGLTKVDSSGNTTVKVPMEYHDVWVEQSTHKLKVKLNDKIDYFFNNQTLFNLAYNDVIYHEKIDRCMVKKGKKWGMVSTEGELIIPIIYTKIHIMDKYQFLVQKGTKWGVVSSTGTELIPAIYDEFDFRPKKNFFFVRKKGLWGIISLRGGVILPPKYEDMYALPNRKFLVQSKGLWGIVGPGGRVIVPLIYSSHKYKYKADHLLLIGANGQFKKYNISY